MNNVSGCQTCWPETTHDGQHTAVVWLDGSIIWLCVAHPSGHPVAGEYVKTEYGNGLPGKHSLARVGRPFEPQV